jgi:hypothetical protein
MHSSYHMSVQRDLVKTFFQAKFTYLGMIYTLGNVVWPREKFHDHEKL